MKPKKFIKQNVVLVTGVGLPVVVVLFFLAATTLPKFFIAPPQYDLLFTSWSYNYQDKPPFKLNIRVSDGRLQANVYKSESHASIPKLFLFDHEHQDIREITLDLPENLDDFKDGQAVLMREAAAWKISTSRRAPDGYEFRGENYRGIGLVGELFFGSRRGHGFAITKNGASVHVPAVSPRSYYGVNFLGWVTDPTEDPQGIQKESIDEN